MLDYNRLLPKIIRRIITREDFDFTNLPFSEAINAGVLFTDVKNFTKMTEMVSKGGHYSVEIITDLLNSYFDLMNNCIDRYDGDIIKYGGDSILAIFPGDKESTEFRMKACLLDMKDCLIELNNQFHKTYSLNIDFHCNMVWGKIGVNIVGNPAFHLDYFISGEPLIKLFSQPDCLTDYEINREDYKRRDFIENKAIPELKLFFPGRVREWLETNKFSGELKKSAVLFVKIENSDSGKLEIDLKNYNEFYTQLQEIVYFYQGTINKIDFTDKGYLIIITFGVPFLHKDDIERAFICSIKISQIYQKEVKTKIGLTYNNIFSGILGAKERYEYGIIGNAVNISARLMSESPYNDFAFTSEIIPHIKGRYDTGFIAKVNVKGISEEIEIFHITNELSDFWSGYKSNYENSKLFGYDNILMKMEDCLLTCIFGGSSSGKSHLIYEFLKAKVDGKSKTAIFVMSEYDKLKPFTLFYKMINRLLSVENIVDDIEEIKSFIIKNNLNLDLDIVVDYFHEKSSEIKEKTIPLVYDILTEIMVEVLKEVQYIVIENIQWLDYQSNILLVKLIPKLKIEQKYLVLSANMPDIYDDLEIYSPYKIETVNFDKTLATEYFFAENITITPKAITEILTLSQNNPAYIKEICKIIKNNWIKAKGVFDYSDFHKLIQDQKLPNSFENVLLNDFESLDDDTKQLLKYASIMGVSFSDQLLDIFSEEFIKEHIEQVLVNLTSKKHIFKKLILPEIEYFFNNALMRDAIYRTILLKEKQKLHLVIANYYLKNFQEELSAYYEVVANHLILANSKSNTVKWCLLAAKKNFELSAYGISSYYYSQAVKFSQDKVETNDLLFSLVSVNVAQNKVQEATKSIALIDETLLSQEQIDLLYFYKIRLFEIRRDFKNLKDFYSQVKVMIKSEEVLSRIKLILLDYYRMSNASEQFEFLKEELMINIDSQAVTIKIIYYSILGQYYLDRAQYAIAEDNYQNIKILAVKHHKKGYNRIAETSLGIIQVRQGNQDKALEHFQKALSIAEDIGDKHGFANVNTEIAMIYFAQGLDDQALSKLNDCLHIAKYIGDKQQEQTVLYNFGYIYSVLQKFDTAIEYLTQAHEIAEIIDDKVGIAYANDGLGDAYFQIKQFSKAKKIYEENLEYQKRLQDKEGIAHTIGNLANVLREEKNYSKALEYYQIQQESLQEIGDKIGEGKALFNWGITCEMLGNIDLALEKLEEANRLFSVAKDKNYADFSMEQIERIKKKVDKSIN